MSKDVGHIILTLMQTLLLYSVYQVKKHDAMGFAYRPSLLHKLEAL